MFLFLKENNVKRLFRRGGCGAGQGGLVTRPHWISVLGLVGSPSFFEGRMAWCSAASFVL